MSSPTPDKAPPGRARETVRSDPLDRACDFFLAAFGAWTAACHLVVFAGGSLYALALAFPLLFAGTLFLCRRLRGIPLETSASLDDGAAAGPSLFSAGLGLASGAAVVAVWLLTKSVTATWWCMVLVAAAAFALNRPDAHDASPARTSRRAHVLLAGLAVASALATQLLVRPDIDDCYYVNVSAAIATDPGAPLLARDTLYGIADLPLMLSVYRLHSFEVLAGAIAWATPLSAIEAAHWIVPALFGFFIPLAAARLLRRLLPRTWMEALLVVLALLLVTAETHRWWGNFAFVRQHQGKGVFLTVLVPLLFSYGLDFARRPTRLGFLRLAIAQLAAIGATATALWAAPVAAGLGLAAGIRFTRPGLAAAIGGLAASLYPVGLGLAVRNSTAKVVSRLPLPGFEPIAEGDHAALARSAWELSAGDGPLALATLFAVAAAWAFAPTRAARRFLAGIALLFLLLLNSPYTAWWIADGVTSSMTYFRVFWVLPVPIFLAVILSSPAHLLPRHAGRVVCALLTAVFLWQAPRLYALDVENNERFDPFALKVHEDEYEAARLLVESTPPRSKVVATQFVAVYVGTFENHPYAVVSRLDYLRFLEPYLERVDIARRGMLGGMLAQPGSTQDRAAAQAFARSLDELQIKGVAFFKLDGGMRLLLQQHGFQRAGTTDRYDVWVRD